MVYTGKLSERKNVLGEGFQDYREDDEDRGKLTNMFERDILGK